MAMKKAAPKKKSLSNDLASERTTKRGMDQIKKARRKEQNEYGSYLTNKAKVAKGKK
jgi:hypothetical protein